MSRFRHKSKFRRSVQDETVKTKASHRTMGPAKVTTRPPDMFLKKHEREQKMAPESESPVTVRAELQEALLHFRWRSYETQKLIEALHDNVYSGINLSYTVK